SQVVVPVIDTELNVIVTPFVRMNDPGTEIAPAANVVLEAMRCVPEPLNVVDPAMALPLATNSIVAPLSALKTVDAEVVIADVNESFPFCACQVPDPRR